MSKKNSDKEEELEKVNLEEIEEMDDCEDGVIELVDDQGNSVSLEFVMSFDLKGNTYCVFDPVEDKGEFKKGEGVILKYVEGDDEEETFEAIETKEELDEAFQEFLRLQEEMDDYDDEDDCDDDCDCGCDHDKKCDCKKN